MEENTVKVNEIIENEPEVDTVVDEATEESSGSGALVAGMVGGFLAYAVIGGVRKLVAFAQTKLAERKQKTKVETVIDAVIDAEFTEIPDKQDMADEAPEEK